MSRRRGLVLAGVAVALALAAASARAQAQAADRFWQVEPAAQFAGKDKAVTYLRSRPAGDGLALRRGCEAGPGPDPSRFSARIDDNGRLLLSTGGTPYGTGRAVAPFACVNGWPDKIRLVTAPVRGPRGMAAATPGPADPAGPPGGDLSHLASALGVTLPTQRPPPLPAVTALPDSDSPLPSGDLWSCRGQQRRVQETRLLQNVPTLGVNGQVWPGALLQGRPYGQGSFAPITIPRAGGSVTISGVNFSTRTPFTSTFQLSRLSAADVQQNIGQLLAQQVASTEAQVDFRPERVFNSDQMAYAQGLDGRFLNGLDNHIMLDPASGANYVLARFRQTYYTASFEAPESRTAVFRDGAGFTDPEGQIGADNPPLYVSDVGYGRVIYFLVSSPFDADVVIRALQSADSNSPDAGTTVQGRQVSYSEILRQSVVSYSVQGGDAIATLGPMGRIDGAADMYEALRKTITDSRLAQVTEFSKGVPVSYTVSYLTDRSNAAMGFSAAYSERTCSTVAVKRYASYSLHIHDVDDSAQAWLIDGAGQRTQVYGGGSLPADFDLDSFIPDASKDETFVLQLALYNIGGPSSLRFQLVRRGFPDNNSPAATLDPTGKSLVPPDVAPGRSLLLVPNPMVSMSGQWGIVGWVADYRVRINRSTGDMTVIQGN